MGEIGFNEEKFLTQLQWWQIRTIIRGYRRRERTSWMQTRILAYAISHMMGGEQQDLDQFMPLPWDKEDQRPKTKEEQEQEDKELQALIEQCKRENEELAKQQQNGNNR